MGVWKDLKLSLIHIFEERKIQRLFRNGNVTRLIKKSNDFGAGGVCVAIGELADGLEINLDKVPLKYLSLIHI